MSIGLGIGVQRPKQLRSIYSVDGKVPGFTADFIKNKYPGYTSLSSAITHSRSGNAVMTDGYGPELVVNGGFDSDLDWTLSNMYVEDGVLRFETSQTTGTTTQNLSMVTGKTYVLRFFVSGRTTGNLYPRLGSFSNLDTLGSDANGWHEYVVNFDGSQNLVQLVTNVGFDGSIDNVSVREMPVLKWAPHNQFPESEDVSGWSLTGLTPTTNATTAPDGTTTADLLTVTNGASSTLATNATDTGDVFALWVKNNGADFLSVYFSGYSGRAWVDLSDFTAGSATGNISIKGITSAGNDWYLIEFQKQDNSSRAPVITLTDANNGGTVTGDGVKGIYVWGAHLYRSDLGGMVDNPDQPLSRASYVPTTTSAKYLPRIGHHVYNGNAWVNEGLLAESELRSNLWLYSNDPTNAAWSATRVTKPSSATITGPDGQTSGYLVVPTAISGNHFIVQSFSLTTGVDYTLSFYLKEDGLRYAQIIIGGAYSDSDFANFDLQDGVIGSTSTAATATIQDVGNGWYRCSCTFTANATATGNSGIAFIESLTDGFAPAFTPDGTSGVYVYGAQLEVGDNNASAPTPSSLIPTSGQQGTREAESFTIPSANLPWPEPNYIGSELVDNGDFSDTSEWSTSTWTISGGVASADSVADSNPTITQNIGATNDFYAVTLDVVTTNGTGTLEVYHINLGPSASFDISSTGTKTVYLKGGTHASNGQVSIRARGGFIGSIDNISVREIDPLSVSIAMDGRVTYADTGAGNTVKFSSWIKNNNDNIKTDLDTSSTRIGEVDFEQTVGGVIARVSATGAYSPDILVPFNIASRHGSTFINGATDGVALTANTTPTALPDLSATDLDLGRDYMGTIGTFRVWDKDLGDDGIVEATNPSLEPSLSLTFEGTGTNSFVINDWSE